MMSKTVIWGIIFFVALLGFVAVSRYNPKPEPQDDSNKAISSLKISSRAFSPNGSIPKKYTCDGEGINPPFKLEGVLAAAKSFALIVNDPDAPSGTFTHWVIWNIPASTKTIEEDKTPDSAVEGKNSAGKNGYFGPCPPSGTHHYVFKLFAIDSTLNLPPDSSKAQLEETMKGHIVGQGELIGLYSRK